MKDRLTEDDLRALAQTAVRSPRSPDRLPPWIGDLAALPPPSFHALDRVMHAGLIAWDDGWHVTDAGWRTLSASTPKDHIATQEAP
jgi:hypothetical protein